MTDSATEHMVEHASGRPLARRPKFCLNCRRLGPLEAQIRRDWRRMHFCRRNGWRWYARYRNRLWAAFALRRIELCRMHFRASDRIYS